MHNRTVLISGASIAGPALAYWLHRYGFHPTVVERALAVRAGGYKIDVRGAAVEVLQRMDLHTAVQRASTAMQGTSFVDSANRTLATMSADFFMGRQGDDVEIMRGDLAQLLYDATHNDIEYLFDNTVTSMTQDTHGVDVTFARGDPRRFDLVVGADGLHSTIRALTFGAESHFIRHLGAYISIFTIHNYLKLDRWEMFYNVPGKLINMYSAQKDSEAKALFVFSSPPLEYQRQDITQQKKLLTDAFADVGWEVPRLLNYLQDAPDFYFDSLSQVHMDGYSNGRVALIGDASYCPSPASGQGTSLALVGAYVLAGELKRAAGDHRIAYAAYEQAIHGYVEQNLTFGQNMAKEMVPQSRWHIWFRTQMLRVLPYLPWKGVITKGIVEPIQHAANAITLKDYLS